MVAGAKAIYKGVGTRNGRGSYTFMPTAIDGDLKHAADTFRIHIWTEASAINADVTAVLSGSSIIVHKQ